MQVNSGGTNVLTWIAIYNILKNTSANKKTNVEGLSASAVSVSLNEVIILTSLFIYLPTLNKHKYKRR